MATKICAVCNNIIMLKRESIYTAKETNGAFAVLSSGIKEHDAIDCPHCSCQNILGERLARVLPEPPESGLNKLAADVHENAKAHGWWDDDRSFGEVIALIHSELSEALEEYREGKPDLYCGSTSVECEKVAALDVAESDGKTFKTPCISCELEHKKPQGIAIELADTMIRILDYCGHAGIDIERAIRLKHEYNKTREYRHGGKVI